MSVSYETIAANVDCELEVSRSRFITRLVRIEVEAEARAVIAQVRAEQPRARHHCTAFVLGADQRERRSNDDGEPSGTAGAPMLDALVSSGLSDVVAVVTRYFGGVLLGAGGLTRTYRAAVAQAVAAAPRLTRVRRITAHVTVGYSVAPVIESEARRRGIGVGAAVYGSEVRVELLVVPEQREEAAALVREVSAGAAELGFGDELWADVRV